MNNPKILIINRLNWSDNSSSNTRTNLWKNYNPEKLALIYIETKLPDTICCKHFFQISEYSLIKKLYKWRTITGKVVSNGGNEDSAAARNEEEIMKYVRAHRSYFFTFLREILWSFNGWKSKELRRFIQDFNPDIVWVDGSPLILMNRLFLYVQRVAKKPSIAFLMDDAYTFKSCPKSVGARLYRLITRPFIRKVVKNCSQVFVCSPKMKREYDVTFGIDSIFLPKGEDVEALPPLKSNNKRPIKMVYMGNTLLGRIFPLIDVVKALDEVNKTEVKAELLVYSTNSISSDLKVQLERDNYSHVMKPVTFIESKRIMSDSDVVIFVESQEKECMNIARLSFSTKIVDYLACGQCILAIGDKTIAPIEYFLDEDAALVATSKNEIFEKIHLITNDSSILNLYAENARKCLVKNHNIKNINEIMYSTISSKH